MGVAGLVLGILGVLASINPFSFWVGGPLGLIALVLGLVGHRQARAEGRPTGTAAAGIALGGVACALSLLLYVSCHMLCSGAKCSFEKNFAEPLKKAIEEAEQRAKAEREQGLPLDREHALKVSAAKLASDLEANSIAFRNRYQEVTIEVTGDVVTIAHDTNGYADLDLVGGEPKPKTKKRHSRVEETSDESATTRVKCRLTKSQDARVLAIHRGDHVTVVGIGEESLGAPALKGCVFK